MRTIALVVGMLGLLGPIDVWAAASECEEVSAPVPPVDGKWPVASNCCEAALGDSCSAVAPGLVGGRQNVVLTVLDDHGYCQNGFMAGRCVIDGDTGSALQRCGGTVCSNAPWLACATTSDCPTPACGDPAVTCDAPVSGECAGDRWCATDTDCGPEDTCDTESKRCNTTANDCTHGYCRQCAPDGTGCREGDICVDGLCSPRAACDAGSANNDYMCARGLGRCDLGSGGFCTDDGSPCDDHEDCGTTGAACSPGACVGTGAPCAADGDCNDTCDGGSCAATPASCYSDNECQFVTGVHEACASSSRPLRLADPSCRYRHAGDDEWDYDLTTAPTAGVRLVLTPTIDALAMEGAVFPWARGGGQKCQPGRAVIGMGRLLRHVNAAGDSARVCAESRTAPISHPMACDDDSDCGLGTAGTCDDFAHTTPFWLSPDAFPTPPAVAYDAHTIAVGKSDFINHYAQNFDIKFPGGSNDPKEPDIGKFPCAEPSPPGTPANAGQRCPGVLRQGALPTVALASGQNYSLKDVVDTIRAGDTGASYDDGMLAEPFYLYYAPHLPHAESNTGLPSNFYFSIVTPTADGSKTLARTAWTDAGLEVIANELKRTCVCGEDAEGNPQPESLYENTVFMSVSDHGFLLYRSKQSNEARDNAHREAMVISTPEHRAADRSVVLDRSSQFAGNQDVLPTVLSYMYGDSCDAGSCAVARQPCTTVVDCDSGDTCDVDRCVSTPQACSTTFDCRDGVSMGRYVDRLDNYPMNASLRGHADLGMSRGFLRSFYGHSGEDLAGVGENPYVYAVPDPTLVGLCEAGEHKIMSGHVRPCIRDVDCDLDGPQLGDPTPSCRRFNADSPSTDPVPRRCINMPDVLCTSDADCTKCVPSQLGTTDGSHCGTGCTSCLPLLPDQSKVCGYADRMDCVPKGMCSPPHLKAYRKKASDEPYIAELFDVDVDPDERNNLMSGGEHLGDETAHLIRPQGQWGTYTPCNGVSATTHSLHDVLVCCIEEFFWLENGSQVGKVWRPRDFRCPDEFREWAIAWPTTTTTSTTTTTTSP